jgi:predicted MFS family arabinose efflux permease
MAATIQFPQTALGRTGGRRLLVGLVAFLTLVDLFGAQAILPTLAASYAVSPAAMGAAVNASTLGMAVAGLAIAAFAPRIDRRKGVCLSLVALAAPTLALAVAPNLETFALLRVAQGLCMATAFTLTLAYLGEHAGGDDAAGAFAAYVTGNVASNLVGRLLTAGVADHLGLVATFVALAALNLAGAALAHAGLARTPPMAATPGDGANRRGGLGAHLRDPRLVAAFAVGFLILFAFIGVFTYVNFVLTRDPFALATMSLGLVYLVFAPSILTTPLAGRAVARFGARATLVGSLGLAACGAALLLASNLAAVLGGLALVGVGTFLAQATATGHVGRVATGDRGAASGLYLASYFGGGLAGGVLLGQVFDRWGWGACVAGIAAALIIAALLSLACSSEPRRPS